MIIREAHENDNETLNALEQSSPQGDTVKLLNVRKDYFFRARKFIDPILLVAEDNKKKIQGVMGIGPLDVRLGNKTHKAGYIFDWRSNPDNPKGMQRPLLRLWLALKAHIEEQDLSFIFGFVKEDNLRSLSIVSRYGTEMVGKKSFLTIPIYKKFAAGADEAILDQNIDATAEYKLLKKQFGEMDLFSVRKNMDFLQNLYDNYLYGKVIMGNSSIKIWDTSDEYFHRVLNIPTIYKIAKPIFKIISPIVPLPHIPEIGAKIKFWNLFDLNLDRESDLPVMLEKIRLEALKNDIDYLIICIDEKDRENKLLKRLAWIKLDYHLIILPFKDIPIPEDATYYDCVYL